MLHIHQIFLSFFGSKNECIIYTLFYNNILIKVILFTQKKVNIKMNQNVNFLCLYSTEQIFHFCMTYMMQRSQEKCNIIHFIIIFQSIQ